MKVLIPLLIMILPVLAIEPPKKAAEQGQTQIGYVDFHKGCTVAAVFLANPDMALSVDTDDLSEANTALNYIRGFFDAARQIQDYNPDLRVLDPEWQGCDVEEYVARVKEIMDGLEKADPGIASKLSPRDVVALAVRSRSGTPDLNQPR